MVIPEQGQSEIFELGFEGAPGEESLHFSELDSITGGNLEVESELPQDECGVVLYFSPERNASFFRAATATRTIQSRGSEAFGGYVLNDGTGKFEGHKAPGKIDDVVREMPDDTTNRLAGLTGKIAMTHVQWGTYKGRGRASETAQPYAENRFAGAHNGNAENAMLLAIDRGIPLGECPTDSIAIHKVVEKDAKEMGGLLPALKNLQSELKGAYSLVYSDGDKAYGMRDEVGLKPLGIGERPDGTLMFASESVVFDAENAKYIREVERGEIVEIKDGKDGPELISHWDKPEVDEEFCALEIGYFMRPDSIFRGMPVRYWREKLGEQLAEEVMAHNPDMDPGKYVIIGVPESGLASAEGFSRGTGIENATEVLEKILDDRSYIAATKEQQEKIAENKLSIDAEALYEAIWDDETNDFKDIFLKDDSVVKGNQISKLVARFDKLGVPKEKIHIMIAFPELVEGCHLGSSIEKEKLLSYEREYQEKCEKLGVASLTNLSLGGFKKVIPDSCGGCFGAEYPVAPLEDSEDLSLVEMLAGSRS